MKTQSTKRASARARTLIVSVLLVVLATLGLSTATTASATTPSCGDTIATVSGVDVYSNAQGGKSWGYDNCGGGDNYVNGADAGGKWQCVEFVNRYYLTKGWTTSHWFGNGNTLKNSLPSTKFTYQANGQITSIVPGDVVTLDDGGYGHAGVVSSVDTNTNMVTIANQNIGSTAYKTVAYNPTAKTLASELSGYSTQVVIHTSDNTASGIGSSTPPPPPPPPADSPSSTDAVLNQTSGMTQVFVQGPNDSLQTYWWKSVGGWDGPYQIAGSGTTYSKPTAVQNQTTGQVQVFAEGPNNTLQTYYWSDGVGWNSYQIAGSGTVYSTPSAVLDQSNGMVQVFFEGANNALQTYWWKSVGGWDGPYQIAGANTTYSAPTAVQWRSNGMVQVFAEGTSNSLQTYYWSDGVGWNSYQIAGSGTVYSDPGAVLNQASGMTQVFVQGPNNALETYYWFNGVGWASYQIAGANTTYWTP